MFKNSVFVIDEAHGIAGTNKADPTRTEKKRAARAKKVAAQ